jgi:flagellar motor switch protein FliN/FliY
MVTRMADDEEPATDPTPPETPAPQAAAAAVAPEVAAPGTATATATAATVAEELDPSAIDELLKSASFDDGSAAAASASAMGGDPSESAADFKLPDFQQVMRDAQVSSIDLLRDVDLNVKIELGRSRMLVEDVLKLAEGSVVELDKLAGDPVDVFVNDRLVARGEVLVLNDNFCVRINEIVAGVREEGV